MAKVIIAIHGLRNKPPKSLLMKWGRMAIEEGFENLGLKVDLPEFEMVYWADILYDKPLSPDINDPSDPYFLDEVYTRDPEKSFTGNHDFQKKTHRFLKKIIYKIFLSKNYKLRYPFLSKSFIHNNFRDLEIYFTEHCESSQSKDCLARKAINQRLIDVLIEHANDEIFLIAHSMGSIIAFDVLSFILKDIKINTLVTIGSPLGAPFVVSRIAQHSKRIKQSDVSLKTPETVTKKWYNFSDIRDSIAIDYKLADDFASNSYGVKVVDTLVTNTYQMDKTINPHKSFGYLRTPEFIKVLNNFIKE
ncbi:MAG: GPI inositol-deacylase [Bacteroidales bacterium]|nr:GPI inositol-deacylase [Bacteroidales bacterium]